MMNLKKLTVSHAPFLHNGGSISSINLNIMLAASPAIFMGICQYKMAAVGVMALSISLAMMWELLFNMISKKSPCMGDWSTAVYGMLFGMMLPATAPWWLVVAGTFVTVVLGREIFGGLGGNPFNPAVVGIAILMVSWPDYFDFTAMLVNYDFDFKMLYLPASLKHFGVSSVASVSTADLLLGRQPGAIGATFGLGLLAGGIYLILRGIIRWEISLSFLAGIAATSMVFSMVAPSSYAGPMFHLLTGYTLLGAFFLATEHSSSPTGTLAMIIYGAGAGVMTILIRNLGAYVDGVVLAIILMNLVNPILDNIRPKAFGKV